MYLEMHFDAAQVGAEGDGLDKRVRPNRLLQRMQPVLDRRVDLLRFEVHLGQRPVGRRGHLWRRSHS